MTALFSKPKTPKVPEATPVPTRDDAVMAYQDREKADKRQGKLSTILAQDKSRTTTPTTAKTVLGS